MIRYRFKGDTVLASSKRKAAKEVYKQLELLLSFQKLKTGQLKKVLGDGTIILASKISDVVKEISIDVSQTVSDFAAVDNRKLVEYDATTYFVSAVIVNLDYEADINSSRSDQYRRLYWRVDVTTTGNYSAGTIVEYINTFSGQHVYFERFPKGDMTPEENYQQLYDYYVPWFESSGFWYEITGPGIRDTRSAKFTQVSYEEVSKHAITVDVAQLVLRRGYSMFGSNECGTCPGISYTYSLDDNNNLKDSDSDISNRIYSFPGTQLAIYETLHGVVFHTPNSVCEDYSHILVMSNFHEYMAVTYWGFERWQLKNMNKLATTVAYCNTHGIPEEIPSPSPPPDQPGMMITNPEWNDVQFGVNLCWNRFLYSHGFDNPDIYTFSASFWCRPVISDPGYITLCIKIGVVHNVTCADIPDCNSDNPDCLGVYALPYSVLDTSLPEPWSYEYHPTIQECRCGHSSSLYTQDRIMDNEDSVHQRLHYIQGVIIKTYEDYTFSRVQAQIVDSSNDTYRVLFTYYYEDYPQYSVYYDITIQNGSIISSHKGTGIAPVLTDNLVLDSDTGVDTLGVYEKSDLYREILSITDSDGHTLGYHISNEISIREIAPIITVLLNKPDGYSGYTRHSLNPTGEYEPEET